MFVMVSAKIQSLIQNATDVMVTEIAIVVMEMVNLSVQPVTEPVNVRNATVHCGATLATETDTFDLYGLISVFLQTNHIFR